MKARRITFLSAITVLICLFLVSAASAADSEFIFRGGLARPDATGMLEIYKETTDVPFVTKAVDPNYHFGVIAYAKNENTCKCRVNILIPKAVDTTDKDSALLSSKPSPAGSGFTTISSDETACSTIYYALIQLDEGDLPGTYSIEIYIDGVLKKRFDFNVVQQPKK